MSRMHTHSLRLTKIAAALLAVAALTTGFVCGGTESAYATYYGILDTTRLHFTNEPQPLTQDTTSYLNWQYTGAPDSIYDSLGDSTKVDSVFSTWSTDRGGYVWHFNSHHPALLAYTHSHGGFDTSGNWFLAMPMAGYDVYPGYITSQMSAYGATGYGSRPVFFMGACSSTSQTGMYTALFGKGWSSYLGFGDPPPGMDGIPTRSNARLARYFFYYGTRTFRHATVWQAYVATKQWALAHPDDLIYPEESVGMFDCWGVPSYVYMNW